MVSAVRVWRSLSDVDHKFDCSKKVLGNFQEVDPFPWGIRMRRSLRDAKIAFFQRENGYIAHPIPTPINRKRNSDHTMYFTRSIGRRRLRKPNAMEISNAKSSNDWK